MSSSALDNRIREVRDIHHKYIDFYHMGGGLSLVLGGIWLGALIFGQQETSMSPNLAGYLTNIWTELLSVVVTILIIERLNMRREREHRKQDLIRQTGSIANDIAVDAVEQLRKADWLTGDEGVLQGKVLSGANLEKARLHAANLQASNMGGANLKQANLQYCDLQQAYLGFASLHQADVRRANLEGADFEAANLQSAYLQLCNLRDANLAAANLDHADLVSANMQGVNLESANLQHTNLEYANLQDADLRAANLQHADLRKADLRGANLRYANLKNAKDIEMAIFDEMTVLPDAEPIQDEDEVFIKDENGIFRFDKYWTADIDMTRYTNPEHPEF